MAHSPFLAPGSTSKAGSLAILHLRRDQLLPITLEADDPTGDKLSIVNTRFGAYPHSTLIGLPWGSQVLASDVSNKPRSKRNGGSPNKKRKIDAVENDSDVKHDDDPVPSERHQKAASGFCHILPPTPETWTVSLPHRTQVVYTPDYSYILQKMRVRPGCVLVEAGAGSGSFTHAAARAVYYGSPPTISLASTEQQSLDQSKGVKRFGKVYSFEYHVPRAKELMREIEAHGLSSLVHVTHRDVYQDGFLVSALENVTDIKQESTATVSPQATHVFLDLPSPWQALPNLTRASTATTPSPLDPNSPVHICIFLPCIEQVTRAIANLRQLGWVEISMQELQHRRLDVRRELMSVDLEGLRGVNTGPATVEEAMQRLKEVESRGREWHAEQLRKAAAAAGSEQVANPGESNVSNGPPRETKAARLARIAKEVAGRKMYKAGRLVHKTEPELKTHTSYLVFAVLPQEWSAEDEARCRLKWPVGKGKENWPAVSEQETKVKEIRSNDAL